MQLKYTFEISEEAFAFLKDISDGRFLEYRDIAYPTVAAFLDSEDFKEGFRTLKSFKARNEEGTYSLCEELANLGFVKLLEGSWYISYSISDLGKKILQLNS
jgi:hypothetical protein